MRIPKDTWLWIGAGLAGFVALNWAQSQGMLPTTPAAAPATPLSIYPELAYTATPATTSMATTGVQQAPAAVVPPTPLFTSVQGAETSAVLSQCVGSNVCSPLVGDTQLGL